MSMRSRFWIVLCSVILVVGCADKSKDRSEGVFPSLKIGAMSSMDYIPFIVAEEMGFCDSLGVDVEIVKFFSANDRDASFRAGSVDGTVIDFTGAALQHANGVPLALVMKHDGLFYMVAKPDIENIHALQGKKVAVSRNTVIEYSTDLMLSAGKIPMYNQVEKVEINKIPVRMQMLLEGEVDASIFPEPFASMAQQQGMHTLMNTREVEVVVTGMAFSTDAIKDKRESIRSLIQAYNMAVDYIHTHPRTEWMHLLVQHAGVPKGMEETIELPEYTHAELPDAANISMVVQWLKDRQLVPEDYDAAGLVDKSLLKGLN